MSEDLPIEVVCRVVGVSVSAFCVWRNRKPSARAVRHAMLADVIREVHDASRQTYGARRVHAELVLGRNITVARCTVELVMRRLGLAGLPGRRKYRTAPNAPSAEDLVTRDFARTALNGTGMAIENRQAEGVAIHSDHGTQGGFTSWAFTRRALDSGLVPSMGSIGDYYDNGQMESFWARMQAELLNRKRWNTRLELANAIIECLEIFLNRQRRNSSLGTLSPIEHELRHADTTARDQAS